MGTLSLILLAVGVSMDTFAVSLCNGMSAQNYKKCAVVSAVWFSSFQVIMLLLGYLLFCLFDEYVDMFDHWIAFFLFFFNGAKTIKDSGKNETRTFDLKFKSMLSLSFATSIDALAVGISFSLLGANAWLGTIIIFISTFLFTVLGTIIGNKFGQRYKKKATIFGGVILILMGIKILIEGLFF